MTAIHICLISLYEAYQGENERRSLLKELKLRRLLVQGSCLAHRILYGFYPTFDDSILGLSCFLADSAWHAEEMSHEIEQTFLIVSELGADLGSVNCCSDAA